MPVRMNPVNGVLRFALELSALVAMGWWGYEAADGALRYALMIGVPSAAATAWAVFAVPGDPSRGDDGKVRVSGAVRLVIELVVFGFGTWTLRSLGEDGLAVALGSAIFVHYAFSWTRLRWLLAQGR